ncbi:putative hydrogenase maturase HydE [Paratrimastix pyriformis]|uniref:Hydrogenase maturase HydE n=1 Tax=Paratrimastix pyriformis TaxID=342808 RepID=M4QSW6_9EUKA|nr:hydrogenase maturase HydE [Paratrimastix pyriformis]KAJ4459635.1 putative hydrogenase maturase HydE [Paratrimastix pyriformis]
MLSLPIRSRGLFGIVAEYSSFLRKAEPALPFFMRSTPIPDGVSDRVRKIWNFGGENSLSKRPESEAKAIPDLSFDELKMLLQKHTPETDAALFRYSNSIANQLFGNKCYVRALVEFSNVCRKNCKYCGIRKDMKGVRRYTIPDHELMALAKFAYENKFTSLVLQSGELGTETRISWLCDMIKKIVKETNDGLRIVISIGELPHKDYKALFDAGARRTLTRIETSNPKLYAKLHPKDHSWQERVDVLKDQSAIGYMMGTGVMAGVPHQVPGDLANDILFLRDMKASMIGMGPWIPSPGTPLGDPFLAQMTRITQRLEGRPWDRSDLKKWYNEDLLKQTLRMYACARIVCYDVNMAATTALEVISPTGRQQALRAGCNIMMPNITPRKYRDGYEIYTKKAEVDGGGADTLIPVGTIARVDKVAAEGGRVVDWGVVKDPLHHLRKWGGHPPGLKGLTSASS